MSQTSIESSAILTRFLQEETNVRSLEWALRELIRTKMRSCVLSLRDGETDRAKGLSHEIVMLQGLIRELLYMCQLDNNLDDLDLLTWVL
jgi:hypothetical protein